MVTAAFAAAALLLCALVLAPLARLAPARRTAAVLAVALPATALGVYLLLGTPAALDPKNVAAPETLDDAIAQLERRLEEEPGSVEGWVLLGRSRLAQERYADASAAFARAVKLLPQDPDLRVEYADALMRAAPDGRFTPEATALLEAVVADVPDHQRGLFYLGAQRYQSGRPAEAAALWERLLPLVEPKTAAVLRPQLDTARAEAGLPPLPAAPAASAGPAVTVTVDIAPALAARLPAGATLFVYARPLDGAGPPVAAERVDAATLPATVVLDDADSLMPTSKLSAQPRVAVTARLSTTGDAAGAAGDLEATPREVAVGDGAAVTLTLDRLRE